MSNACPNCGRLNRPGARFCASCQTPLLEGVGGGPAPASGQPLQPGQLLGGASYRVVRPLGKGGMGAVWLVAQTRAFDRLAVLKEVIDYFDAADGDARSRAAERFEAEGRTLAELKHPGIPDLYAFFSEAGHNYLVMEYIEGTDLSQGLTHEHRETGELVPGTSLPAEQVVHYTIEICEVLEYLARCQPPVVHNDIKPGNIIIDSHSGRAVLVDFGTARTRYLRAPGQPDRKKESVYGTVGYAAPELYQGRSESRSDVYSLAATAYHLLTDDDPRDHPGEYPKLDALPALADRLRPALAPNVDDRPAAEQFRQALETYLAGMAAPMRGLTFPDRSEATTRQELLALVARHWSYASSLLQDGTLARWLRGTLRDAEAAQAAEDAVSRWPADPDAALDAFLRRMAPSAMPTGKMELRTASLSLTAADPRQPILTKIELANRGPGYLRGRVLTSQPWVKLSSAAFGCTPGGVCVVQVEIDPSGLAPAQPHVAAVTLEPDGGGPEVIPVQVVVAAREAVPASARAQTAIAVAPNRVDFGTVSRGTLSTARQRIVVTNSALVQVRCRVVDAPAWLIVKPADFRLSPGGRQTLEMVGRVDKVPGSGQEATLAVAADSGQTCQVRVSIRIRGR